MWILLTNNAPLNLLLVNNGACLTTATHYYSCFEKISSLTECCQSVFNFQQRFKHSCADSLHFSSGILLYCNSVLPTHVRKHLLPSWCRPKLNQAIKLQSKIVHGFVGGQHFFWKIRSHPMNIKLNRCLLTLFFSGGVISDAMTIHKRGESSWISKTL